MAAVKHVFVVGRGGQSVIMKGPFLDAATAKAWIAKYRAHDPCWLIPAEFAGLVPHAPLNEDGKPVQEG